MEQSVPTKQFFKTPSYIFMIVKSVIYVYMVKIKMK